MQHVTAPTLPPAHHPPHGISAVNSAVRFLLEVAGLAAIGVWAWKVSDGGVTRILLTAIAVLVPAALWGVFRADERAVVRVPTAVRIALEVAVFAAATAALLLTGHPGWAAGFALAAAVNEVLDHTL